MKKSLRNHKGLIINTNLSNQITLCTTTINLPSDWHKSRQEVEQTSRLSEYGRLRLQWTSVKKLQTPRNSIHLIIMQLSLVFSFQCWMLKWKEIALPFLQTASVSFEFSKEKGRVFCRFSFWSKVFVKIWVG